jgi:hypothetical protein
MFVMMKKKPAFNADLQSIICKIREITTQNAWIVTYSSDKENRLQETVFAENYTEAYLAFMFTHQRSDEITEIKEV